MDEDFEIASGSSLARGPRVIRRKTMFRVAAGIAALLLLIVIGAVALVPSYLLRSRKLLSFINGHPAKLQLEYSAARSPSPGRIDVDGLELRGSDPNVEWWFRMEHAEIRFSLLDLAGKTFHATSVRARGLSFRLRQRLPPKGRTREVLASEPPIPGFGEVPVRGGPPFFPPPDPPSKLWRVRVDDLEALPVAQIWIDGYRFDGSGRLSGRFALWPRKSASVGPVSLDLGEGRLTVGRNVAELDVFGAADVGLLTAGFGEARVGRFRRGGGFQTTVLDGCRVARFRHGETSSTQATPRASAMFREGGRQQLATARTGFPGRGKWPKSEGED